MSELKPQIQYEDFAKLDLRVGKIVSAVDVVESEKLLKLTVDFGPEIGERTIFAGIKKSYAPQDLEGKQTVFLANLAPKKMPGGESQGMLLAADGENGIPVLLSLQGEVASGAFLC